MDLSAIQPLLDWITAHPNLAGLVVFAIGALAIAGYGFYQFIGEFLLAAEIPFVIKWGLVAIILGVIIILISLIFERFCFKFKKKYLTRNSPC